MRLVPILLATALGLACAPRVPIEGAPCGCPTGYHCGPNNMCVKDIGPPCVCPGGYICSVADSKCVKDDPRMSMGPAIGDAGPPLPQPPPSCSDPGPAPLRRLTAEEYRNTVLDLTGVQLSEAQVPTEYTRLNGVAAPRPGMTAGTVESLLATAEFVSQQAVGRPWEFVKCEDEPGKTECAELFVGGFGERAFRRPITADERKLLLQTFEAGRTAAGFREGVRRVIEVVLSSPQFLYRFEVGEPSERPGVARLTSWELATRLSYLIFVSMPDSGLYRAVWGGYLSSPEGRRELLDLLLQDPRAMRGRISFLERWLDPSAVRLVTKPPEATFFDVELREALITSAHRTFAQVAFASDQNSLFTSSELWANEAMTHPYGLWPPPFGEAAIVRPQAEKQRFGILTYPAILSSLANGAETSPVARGVLFVEEVLCTELPPPPDNIAAVAPAEARMGATMRDRLSEHTNNPACATCHQLFDPVGLGLENYDGYGVFRSHDGVHPINASGRLLGQDFDGPEQLAVLLGQSSKVSDCLVKQWFRYVFGRDPLPTDDCTLQQLKTNFERNGRSLDALLRATVETDAFRTRTITGGGP
jgi:hypothetical protein